MAWFPPVFLLVVPDLIQSGLGTSRERQPGMLPGAHRKQRGKTASDRELEGAGKTGRVCGIFPGIVSQSQSFLCSGSISSNFIPKLSVERKSGKRDLASQEACSTFPFLGIAFWEWEWKGCFLYILLPSPPGPKHNRIKESWNGLG